MVQDHRFVKSMFSQELDRIIISHQDAVHGEALDPSELALILIRGILTENMRHRREYSHTALPQFFKELPDALVSEEIRSHTALRIDPLDCAALSSDPLCNSSELLLCLCQHGKRRSTFPARRCLPFLFRTGFLLFFSRPAPELFRNGFFQSCESLSSQSVQLLNRKENLPVHHKLQLFKTEWRIAGLLHAAAHFL